MKDKTIRLRIDKNMNELLKKLTKNNLNGISGFINKLIYHYITDLEFRKEINLETQQEIKDYLDKKELKERLKEKRKPKEEKIDYYNFVEGLWKQIIKVHAFYFSKKGNMPVINSIIDEAKKDFDKFPEDKKILLKSAFNEILKCKNEKYLIEKIDKITRIQVIKKIRERTISDMTKEEAKPKEDDEETEE